MKRPRRKTRPRDSRTHDTATPLAVRPRPVAGILTRMAKKRKTVQVAATKPAPEPSPTNLTYKQERFIDAYIDNGGNGTRAYLSAYPGVVVTTARTEAAKLLAKPCISEAVEERRADMRATINVTREKALRAYAGMAFCTLADFAAVLKDPENEDAYRGLGDKIHGLEYAKSSFKNGNEIKLVGKKAALDALWDKLGLGEEGGSGNWFDGLGELAEFVRATKGKKR